MTINIKLTTPVYKTSQYGSFDRKADIQIAGDFDSFSEGYTFLRAQIDEFLKQSNAENTWLVNLHDLEREISNKEKTLESLDQKVETAKRQLKRLENFLERLGIDPGSYQLSIASTSIVSPVVVQSEIDYDDSDNSDVSDNDKDFRMF